MPQTILLVGTRKGCFVLESDADRRTWDVRGPFCETGRSTTPCTTGSGAIYAAAASEWHGAGVWRSEDLGATWELSSDGLTYGEESELRLSKLSGMTAAHGRVLAGGEGCGVFESRDGARTWSLLSTLDDQPGRDAWNIPANQPPGHLGLPGLLAHPDDPARFWAVVQGFGIFETTDDGATWTPRNRGLRADWPLENPEVGYCVHKLVMSPSDHDRLYQQNHVGMHRSDDAGGRGTRSRRACRPSSGSLRLRIRTTATASTSSRSIRAMVAACPTAARPCGAPRTPARAGAGSIGVCPSATRTSASCARAWRSTPTTCPGSTSARARAGLRERRRGRELDEIAGYLPAISSVEVAVVA